MALVLAIDQDNHNTKITAEQVVRNMEAASSIDATHATDIRNRNPVDNTLNYAKVKELALQHAPQIARFCRDEYHGQLLIVLPCTFSSNCTYIRPFGALSPQNCPAYAPVCSYAGGTYSGPDPDPMDTSRMVPPASKPLSATAVGARTNPPATAPMSPSLATRSHAHMSRRTCQAL